MAPPDAERPAARCAARRRPCDGRTAIVTTPRQRLTTELAQASRTHARRRESTAVRRVSSETPGERAQPAARARRSATTYGARARHPRHERDGVEVGVVVAARGGRRAQRHRDRARQRRDPGRRGARQQRSSRWRGRRRSRGRSARCRARCPSGPRNTASAIAPSELAPVAAEQRGRASPCPGRGRSPAPRRRRSSEPGSALPSLPGPGGEERVAGRRHLGHPLRREREERRPACRSGRT